MYLRRADGMYMPADKQQLLIIFIKNTKIMLDKEFNFYLAHQNELLTKYENQYIAIVGNEVVGSYPTASEALYESDAKYTPGTCLIQLCTPGNGAYSVRAYTRVCY